MRLWGKDSREDGSGGQWEVNGECARESQSCPQFRFLSMGRIKLDPSPALDATWPRREQGFSATFLTEETPQLRWSSLAKPDIYFKAICRRPYCVGII